MSNEAKVDNYFSTPIWLFDKPEWVNKLNKATDKYIDESYELKKSELKERKKFLGNKDYLKVKDHGHSYHSKTLMGDKNFKELEEYIGATTHNLLNEWGCDVEQYKIYFTEFWVQEFSKRGGGNHDTHTHWDNHMSGFYFLKCSEKTSYPVFHDPRPAAMITKLPMKNPSEVNYNTASVHIKPRPGTLVFFPAYVPHQFTVDDGSEPFRFIHFNLQAVRKIIVGE